jgi:fructose-1,6-bisphosphatase/inositol monophosphatase family enzyme
MENFLEVAVIAAKKAGQVLLNDFKLLDTFIPKGKYDVVTETDLKSEKIIIREIKGKFPTHSILSEESGMSDNQSDYCWIVDPIDGTSNFITGNPYFTVSIALVYKRVSIIGVVYNPVLDELYTAIKGKGAWLNNMLIKPSIQNELEKSLVAVAYAAYPKAMSEGVKFIEKLNTSVRRVVINFAPALDLCNIARGRIDGLIDNGSTPEDHAAGSLILEEAGGVIMNLDIQGWDVMKTGVIATNPLIMNDLIKKIIN